MESLAQLEALCERLYNAQDVAERAHAENTLKCFSMNTEYISQCQYILDNAVTPYALMLASSSLLKQVTEHNLSLQLRIDISKHSDDIFILIFLFSPCLNALKCLSHTCFKYRTIDLCGLVREGNYLISYLATRGPKLQPFVTSSLIQLLSRVTKFGWFDDDRFREIVKDTMSFLSQVTKFLVHEPSRKQKSYI